MAAAGRGGAEGGAGLPAGRGGAPGGGAPERRAASAPAPRLGLARPLVASENSERQQPRGGGKSESLRCGFSLSDGRKDPDRNE